MLWVKIAVDLVEAWYCTCRSGSRAVGMCSHVAAIVWYLSYARHQSRESYGVRDWGVHLSDAAVFNVDVDITCSSESETDQ